MFFFTGRIHQPKIYPTIKKEIPSGKMKAMTEESGSIEKNEVHQK